jgi:paraquat-inducible protein A
MQPCLPDPKKTFMPAEAATTTHRTGLSWPAAFALGALVMYPLAVSLPVLELRKLGHTRQVTVWSGAVDLISEGQAAVGLLVFTCSIVVPLLKLGGIVLLGIEDLWSGRADARRRAHRAIDWIGRWGMLDVLLVAIVVAAIKLGNWADIHPGPGVAAFASVVVMSLLASAVFDPARFAPAGARA